MCTDSVQNGKKQTTRHKNGEQTVERHRAYVSACYAKARLGFELRFQII